MTTGQAPGPAIHVHGLEKSYDELHVLRGVDFDVARGSIFALLGSNGAGKTTTVRILATLLKADAGTAGPRSPVPAIRQHVLDMPAPIVADALGCHHVTTTKLAAEAGATWSRYASGDHSPLLGDTSSL